MMKDVEHFLQCLSAILDSSVESSLFRVLHLVNCIICSLDDQFLEFFLYFGYQSSVWCGVSEDLFPFCRPSFCLVDHVLCFTEAFQCQEVSCIHFISLSVCVTWVVLRKWFPVPVRSSAFDFIFNSYFIIFELWVKSINWALRYFCCRCYYYYLFICFLSVVFLHWGSLCILVCPGTHFIDKAGLRLTQI